MSHSSAAVVTERPGRYAKQLVSHMTRRATGEWDEDAGTGWLDFGTAKVSLTARDGALDLALDAAGDGDPADLDRYEAAVGRHLVRFGAKDELVVQWVRADGSAGSEQRNDGE